jgi:hypothetical protein
LTHDWARTQPGESRTIAATPAVARAPAVSTPARAVSRPGCAASFEAFDENGDARVSEDEFDARPHAHPDPATVFRARDSDRDGSLTEGEFCSAFRPAPSGGPGPGAGQGMGLGRSKPVRHHREPGAMIGARCEQHFTAFDADRDGRLTRQEFSAWPHAHGDADTLFAERDLDHDGTIEHGEFCSAWRGQPER